MLIFVYHAKQSRWFTSLIYSSLSLLSQCLRLNLRNLSINQLIHFVSIYRGLNNKRLSCPPSPRLDQGGHPSKSCSFRRFCLFRFCSVVFFVVFVLLSVSVCSERKQSHNSRAIMYLGRMPGVAPNVNNYFKNKSLS